jgi:hypothetical protein
VNGRNVPFELEIAPDDGAKFWETLVRHKVIAYVCSHILTYDVQVHDGVLQILTGGAGRTREFVHLIQMALDAQGLRYQVLDATGKLAHLLEWPMRLPSSQQWTAFQDNSQLVYSAGAGQPLSRLIVWRFSGVSDSAENSDIQTLVSGWEPGPHLPAIWIGLLGRERRLCVQLRPVKGRSPTYWRGPTIQTNERFDVQLAMHSAMGSGGILWRCGDQDKWSSLSSSASWCVGRIADLTHWSVGHDRSGPGDRAFRGCGLKVAYYATASVVL